MNAAVRRGRQWLGVLIAGLIAVTFAKNPGDGADFSMADPPYCEVPTARFEFTPT